MGRRIGCLMKEAGLTCKTERRFKITTDSRNDSPIAPNHLDRQFSVEWVNQVYVGDITYIPTGLEASGLIQSFQDGVTSLNPTTRYSLLVL